MYKISFILYELFFERYVRTNDSTVRSYSDRWVAPVVFYYLRLWTDDTQCDLLYVKPVTMGE